MWRSNALRFRNNAQENQDSDQSISEGEEGLDGDWTGNAISLRGGGNSKGTMQVLSQLEILRESCERHSAEKESISSYGKKEGYHIEDEVEIPVFNDGGVSSHYHRMASATLPDSNEEMIYLPAVASISDSDEEIISDDEKGNSPTLRRARENSHGTRSGASHEVEALVWSNENSSCFPTHDVSLKEKKSSRGGGGRKKSKPRFLFHSHSHKNGLSLVVKDSNGRTSSSDNILLADEIGAAADDDRDNYMSEFWLNFHDKVPEQAENRIVPFEQAHKHYTRGHSMSEFLNCFLERSDLRQGSSELGIPKRRAQMVFERSMSPLGDSILDDDDLPEALDGGAPFQREDEENAQSVKPIISRTMADQFNETFGTISVIDDRLHVAFPRHLYGSGIYRKLQEVMQSEKERDMDFLKNTSAETSFKDEEMAILVRILSMSLEAKLIVCSCTSIGDGKNLNLENTLEMKMKGIARTLTVIFNPRICSNVDLEVGNLIRMYPPWKEVKVKGEVIFLCSYFAQVQL